MNGALVANPRPVRAQVIRSRRLAKLAWALPLFAFVTPLRAEDGGPSCSEWAALTSDERFFVIGSALKVKYGHPESSKLASCLWEISAEIAEQALEICASEGGAYEEAVGAALDAAVGYCRSQGEQAT
jgi:hypothetical protein